MPRHGIALFQGLLYRLQDPPTLPDCHGCLLPISWSLLWAWLGMIWGILNDGHQKAVRGCQATQSNLKIERNEIRFLKRFYLKVAYSLRIARHLNPLQLFKTTSERFLFEIWVWLFSQCRNSRKPATASYRELSTRLCFLGLLKTLRTGHQHGSGL